MWKSLLRLFTLLLALLLPTYARVTLDSPTQTRSGTVGPCGVTSVPLQPKIEFQIGEFYTFNYTISDAATVPITEVHALKLQFLKFDGNGTVEALRDLQELPNRPVDGPGVFRQTLPAEVDGQMLDCKFEQGERCAFRLHEIRGQASFFSCVDMLTWSSLFNVTSTFIIQPPAGTAMVNEAVFQNRLFQQYGVAGNVLPIGYSASNTRLLTEKFQLSSDGTYTVIMQTRDSLYVQNNQFRAYYKASEMAMLMENNVTLKQLSAIAPNFVSKTFESLEAGITTPPPIENEEEKAHKVSDTAWKVSVLMVFVVVGVVVLFSGYQKAVHQKPLLPGVSSTAV